MEIYSLTLKNKRNPNIFVVYTDKGEFDFYSDILVRDNIQKGEINNEKFFAAHEESLVCIAFNMATKYISSRLKTEQQIKDYLYKKEFHKETVDQVVEKLKNYKIIDDANYALSYAKANPNFSKNKLKQKLYASGVKSAVVADSVAEVDDYSSCLYHAEKYLRNKINNKETIEKLVRRLQSMGYNWDAIKHALNKINFEIED